MKEQLTFEKTRKATELVNISSRCEDLEKEIKTMQDKQYQVRLIEETLATRYAETREKYPIDREAETEAKRLIEEKRLIVDTILKNCYDTIEENKKKEKESLDYTWRYSYGSYFHSTPCYSWKEYEREEKKRAKHDKEVSRKRDADQKRIKNEYEKKRKASSKDSLDELKRVFGELEIDIRHFYKKGLSRETLLIFVGFMTYICKEGEKLGTIPASYQQKIYKWQIVAEEIPIDEENVNKEKEKAAKESLYKKWDANQQAIQRTALAIAKSEATLSKQEEELETLNKKLQEFEATYTKKEFEILSETEQKKQSLQKEYEVKEQRLKKLLDEKHSQLQTKINEAQLILSEKQSELEQLKNQKNGLEEDYDNTFALSFGKKRKLRDQISEVERLILKNEDEIRTIEHELQDAQLEKKSSQKEFSDMLQDNSEALKKSLSKEEDSKKNRLSKLEREQIDLKTSIKKAEKEIPSLQKKLQTLRESLRDGEDYLSRISKELDDFHTDFIIKTFGKELRFDDIIKQKKSELNELNKSAISLKKDISELDAKLEKLEKELAFQQEQQRKAIIEKAKEEERIRLEQKERQERIQRELAEREREQIIINEKSDSILNTGKLISEFEMNPEHTLLESDLCPLEDDGKRIIVNGIVRKHYAQIKETPECQKYVLSFVDSKGNPISDQRLIEQKPIGEKTVTSFELKSANGFSSDNYYLLIMNFETNDVICAQKYKINISFVNDFDF